MTEPLREGPEMSFKMLTGLDLFSCCKIYLSCQLLTSHIMGPLHMLSRSAWPGQALGYHPLILMLWMLTAISSIK